MYGNMFIPVVPITMQPPPVNVPAVTAAITLLLLQGKVSQKVSLDEDPLLRLRQQLLPWQLYQTAHPVDQAAIPTTTAKGKYDDVEEEKITLHAKENEICCWEGMNFMFTTATLAVLVYFASKSVFPVKIHSLFGKKILYRYITGNIPFCFD
jgi:hypothetical protein